MKKNSALSIIAIIGAVLLILGLIVGLIGFAMGGSYNWRNASWYWNNDGWHWGWNNYNGNNYWTNLTDYSLTLENDKITSLDLEFHAGKLEIIVAEQGGYDIKNYPAGALEINFEDGELEIKDTSSSYYSNNWDGSVNDTIITIYITQDYLDSLDVELGVGEFIFKDCHVGDFEHKTGVANSKLTNIKADSYSVSGGVGSFTYRNCDFSDVDASTGTGEFDFQGTLSGSCSFESGVGSMRLDLIGTIDDYYFECDQGIGSINIGNNQSTGLGNSNFTVGNSASPNKIYIETGVGEVRVTFSDS